MLDDFFLWFQVVAKSMMNTVCTLYELTSGEDSEGQGKVVLYYRLLFVYLKDHDKNHT